MPLDFNSEEIKIWSIEELAKNRDGLSNNTPNAVLIDNEIERRKRELQHSLNTQIVDKQLKLMKITTFVTAASTIIAALAGTYLAYALMQIQKPIQIKGDLKQLSQKQTAQKIEELHYGKKVGNALSYQTPIK